MGTRMRPAQAMVELAVGMFALALALSALFGFASFIVKSLDAQRRVRAEAGRLALTRATAGGGGFSSATGRATVEVEPFAAEYIFGTETVEVKEAVHIPNMKGDTIE